MSETQKPPGLSPLGREIARLHRMMQQGATHGEVYPMLLSCMEHADYLHQRGMELQQQADLWADRCTMPLTDLDLSVEGMEEVHPHTMDIVVSFTWHLTPGGYHWRERHAVRTLRNMSEEDWRRLFLRSYKNLLKLFRADFRTSWNRYVEATRSKAVLRHRGPVSDPLPLL